MRVDECVCIRVCTCVCVCMSACVCVCMCVHKRMRGIFVHDKIEDLREGGGQYIEQSEFEIQSTSFQQPVHEAYQLISNKSKLPRQVTNGVHIGKNILCIWNAPRSVCMHG